MDVRFEVTTITVSKQHEEINSAGSTGNVAAFALNCNENVCAMLFIKRASQM